MTRVMVYPKNYRYAKHVAMNDVRKTPAKERIQSIESIKLVEQVEKQCKDISGEYHGMDQYGDEVSVHVQATPSGLGRYYVCQMPIRQPAQEWPYEEAFECVQSLERVVSSTNEQLLDKVESVEVSTSDEDLDDDAGDHRLRKVEYVTPDHVCDFFRFFKTRTMRFLSLRCGIETPERTVPGEGLDWIGAMAELQGYELERDDSSVRYDERIRVRVNTNFYGAAALVLEVAPRRKKLDEEEYNVVKMLLDVLKNKYQWYAHVNGTESLRFFDVSCTLLV